MEVINLATQLWTCLRDTQYNNAHLTTPNSDAGCGWMSPVDIFNQKRSEKQCCSAWYQVTVRYSRHGVPFLLSVTGLYI